MKKLLFVLLVTVALLQGIHTTISAQIYPVKPARGIDLPEWQWGTTNEIWMVSSLANLWWIAAPDDMYPELNRPPMSDRLHTFYYQTQDINATETHTWFPDGSGGFKGFIPIGSADVGIMYYDGRGFGINGLYINRPEMDYVGLFASFNSSTFEIMNLGVSNVNITGRDYVGALVGEYGRSWINNCFSTGSVKDVTMSVD